LNPAGIRRAKQVVSTIRTKKQTLRQTRAKYSRPVFRKITKTNVVSFVKASIKTPNPAKVLLSRGLTGAVLFSTFGVGGRALKELGLTVSDFVKLKNTGTQIRFAGFSYEEIVKAKIPVQILKEAIGPAWVLDSVGFSSKKMLELGYTKKDLTDLGYKNQ